MKFWIAPGVVGLLLVFSSASLHAQEDGGYIERDVKDKDVVIAAKFAIKAAKADGAKIKSGKILSAASQVVAGTNYRLKLQVTDFGGEKSRRRTATAVVYQDLDDNYKLTSWKWNDEE